MATGWLVAIMLSVAVLAPRDASPHTLPGFPQVRLSRVEPGVESGLGRRLTVEVRDPAGAAPVPDAVASPLLGHPASPFSVALFDGGRFTLAEHTGEVVVLNLWASWCVPCREEGPLLEATWRAYRDKGILFIGVNIQDSEEAARAFLRDFGVTYPNGPDPDGRIAIEYGVYGIPETFFIGRDGRILGKHIGAIGPQRLAANLAATVAGAVVSPGEPRRGAYQPIR